MGKLPVVSGQQAVKAFVQLGWTVSHQTGSHIIMQRSGHPTLSIPNHRELAPGLLRGLVRRTEITVGEFVAVLK